jgi:hypothetical protein
VHGMKGGGGLLGGLHFGSAVALGQPVSETLLSSTKQIKSEHMSRITDPHLNDCLQVAISVCWSSSSSVKYHINGE